MAREEKKREEVKMREEAGWRAEETEKGYTYEFYHDIGKKGGQAGGNNGGEATKRKNGHESLEEHRREHAEEA